MIEIHVIESFNLLVHFGTPSLHKPIALGTILFTELKNTSGIEV